MGVALRVFTLLVAVTLACNASDAILTPSARPTATSSMRTSVPTATSMPADSPSPPIGPENAVNLRQVAQLGKGSVRDVSWPTSENVVVSMSTGIFLYDVDTPEEFRFFDSEAAVDQATLTPDGTLIIGAMVDGRIGLWEATTGRLRKTLRAHDRPVTDLAISPDGRSLASASQDGMIKVWDLVTNRQLQGIDYSPDIASSLAYSPDGKTLALGLNEGTVKFIDLTGGVPVRSLTFEPGSMGEPIMALAFSPSGTFLAGSMQNSINLWDVSSLQEVLSLTGHTDLIYDIRFSPDGRTLASLSPLDMTVNLWDVEAGTLTQDFPAFGVWDISPSLEKVVYGSTSGKLGVVDLAGDHSPFPTAHEPTGQGASLAWSPNGNLLASGDFHNCVALSDPATSELNRKLCSPGADTIFSVDFSPDGKTLASVSSLDGLIRLWYPIKDTPPFFSGEEPVIFTPHEDFVSSVKFSPDGSLLASGSWDGTVWLWDLKGQTELFVLRAPNTLGHPAVWDLAFSPQGAALASVHAPGTEGNRVILWELDSGSISYSLGPYKLGGGLGPHAVAYSPDGRYLGLGMENGDVVLWELDSERVVHTLQEHSYTVEAVSFSPNGAVLASASRDGTIRVWDVASGDELVILTGHRGPVFSLAFSPDGRTLATGSEDGTVRLWQSSSQ